jgi:hypothetical protein
VQQLEVELPVTLQLELLLELLQVLKLEDPAMDVAGLATGAAVAGVSEAATAAGDGGAEGTASC